MSFFALSALVNAITCALLGLFVFSKNGKGEINRTFFYYTLAIAAWSGSYFIWQISHEETGALFWTKVLTAGAIFIPVLYTQLVYEVIGRKKEKILIYLVYALAIVFLVLSFGNWLITNVEPRASFDYWPVAGEGYKYYLSFWFGLVIYSTYLLLYSYLHTEGQRKIQSFYFLVASLVGYSGGITNFPLWYDIQIKPWGNILVSVFAFILAYAIVKYRMLNVKIIKTEALVLVIFLALMIDVLISGSVIQAVIRLALLILFGIVGAKLVKSVFSLEDANVKLENDKKDLQELDRMKDEFLQMATHELNTPITVIQGRLDMAIKENLCKLDEKQKEFLTPVLNDTERLASLSRDILDTARIDQHRLIINADETDLDTLIDQIVSDFELKAKEKGNSIAYIRMSKSLPKLRIDKSKIGEVITNLINNANKFTEKGKIAVTSKLTDGGIVVSVADTGVGIEKEAQRHLFEKFYQAGRFDPNNPQEQQGSGLGLYISNNIIKLHGGKMWLESEKGKGSAFYFSLPLVYNESKEQSETDPKIKESNVQTSFNS